MAFQILSQTYGVKPPDFNVIREYRTLERDRLIMQKKVSFGEIFSFIFGKEI